MRRYWHIHIAKPRQEARYLRLKSQDPAKASGEIDIRTAIIKPRGHKSLQYRRPQHLRSSANLHPNLRMPQSETVNSENRVLTCNVPKDLKTADMIYYLRLVR